MEAVVFGASKRGLFGFSPEEGHFVCVVFDELGLGDTGTVAALDGVVQDDGPA